MIEGFKKGADIENVEKYIDKIMREAITNQDGFIDLNEFLKASIDSNILLSKKNMKQVFDVFDLHKSGNIHKSELQEVFGIGTTDKEIWDEVIKQVDKSLTGNIQFEKFAEFLLAILVNKLKNFLINTVYPYFLQNNLLFQNMYASWLDYTPYFIKLVSKNGLWGLKRIAKGKNSYG